MPPSLCMSLLVPTDLVPLERHDLAPPAAREQQMACRRHRQADLFLVSADRNRAISSLLRYHSR